MTWKQIFICHDSVVEIQIQNKFYSIITVSVFIFREKVFEVFMELKLSFVMARQKWDVI